MPNMLRITGVALTVATGLAIAGCGTQSASAQSAKSPSSTASQESISVYAALTAQNGKQLTQDFEKAYPNVTVHMITGGTGLLIKRMSTEQQAGGIRADVILLADPTAMANLAQQHLLANYMPPEASHLSSGLKGTDWVGAFTFNNVIIYHKGMNIPIPKTWTSLTGPAYRNQLELGNPAYSGTTLGMIGYLSKQLGWKYFSALVHNGASMVASTNTVGEDVAAGRKDVGISLDVVARNLQSKGSPIGIVWPTDGTIPVPAPVGVVAKHNTKAAREFEDWLLSSQGQSAVAKLGYVPALGPSSLVSPNAKMASVDWATIGQQRTEILHQTQSIFGQ